MKTAILLALALTPLASGADDIKLLDVKPGLRERTVTNEVRLSEETLAKMTPADRAHLEATMKSRNGMPMTTKVCVTPEAMGKPFSIPGQNCTVRLVSSSALRQEIHYECPSGPHKSSGDVVVELVDPDHLTSTTTMKTGDTGSGADDIKMTVIDKWLSAECGAVKPPTARKQ